jgi:hypothetical protein
MVEMTARKCDYVSTITTPPNPCIMIRFCGVVNIISDNDTTTR